MKLELREAARLAGAVLDGPDGTVLRVVTDSRSVRAGDLFVALRGERFDAHDFVAGALAAGAVAALVQEDFVLPGATLLRAADTRLALGHLAAGWRARFPVRVAGITGSNGKTSVKEMLAAVLRAHAGDEAVLATAGNFNNDIGMPMTLLGLRPAHRFAVIEMGMNHPGELDYLTRLVRPDVALVNNVARAHLGGFDSIDGIARAKSEIYRGVVPAGRAVVNADDRFADFMRRAAGTLAVSAFGLAQGDVTARDVVTDATGSRFVLAAPACEVAVTLTMPGEHNVRNALAAATVALAFDVPLDDIAAGLAACQGAKGRLQRKTAACGATLIDDTYNANPESMKAGLDVLAAAAAPRWFVMGDIGELGDTAAALHAEVGTHARTRGIERVLTLGQLSAAASSAFGEGGRHFATLEELTAFLDDTLPAEATVLIKGSRFMAMERVVAHLSDRNTEGRS